DAAEFSHLLPWTNGQAQLWASTPWWIPFVQAQASPQAAMAWANQWDPTARWLVWPVSHTPKRGVSGSGWRLAYRLRTPEGAVGIWERHRS
ncbi:MAG: hypothetical protein M0Z36_13080, partial [Thermaerobacter sp.]|nr:hypothetical protein [Thermaerobacter sp.]